MFLYLLRHGIAVDRTDPHCPPDPERPLTERGVRRTKRAALGLEDLGVSIDAAFTSPYLRAVQTAELAIAAIGAPRLALRETEALLPEADPDAILSEVRRLRAKHVLCVGHAPHLDRALARALLRREGEPFTRLRKAGAACVDLGSRQAAPRLLWLLEPSMLRGLSRTLD